jgi:hypothetical protein
MLYQVLIGVQKNETLSQRSRWRVAIHWIMDGHPPPDDNHNGIVSHSDIYCIISIHT